MTVFLPSAARLARTSLACALALFATSVARGATILTDNFESYADTAALSAAWPIGLGDDTMIFLDAGPAGSTNTSKTVHSINRLGRRDRSITPTVPTLSQPLTVSFDMYDAAAGGNEYIQLIAPNAAALTQLISIGKSTLATSNGANNPAKYQGRIAFPPAASGGVNWINLNTNRSIGWHRFSAEIFPTTVNFYVDGVLDTANVPRNSGVSDPFTVVRLGSGQSTLAEVAYYDNVSITTVPEPGAVTMLSLGGFIAAAAAWRRRRTA
jgi:hypothetical protein